MVLTGFLDLEGQDKRGTLLLEVCAVLQVSGSRLPS